MNGDFYLEPKVENAIFKVHRSVLAKYSSVIEDMLNVPQGNNGGGGTDEEPLVLIGDKVVGWELLLGWRYERFAQLIVTAPMYLSFSKF
jgi:hypothetical protein